MPSAVLISAFHDYRTAKRASIHQIADGLVRSGVDVAFVSTRFSRLSKRTADSRMFLWDRANRIETVNGVRCFLWRTNLHPFRSGIPLLDRLTSHWYRLYAEFPNSTFDKLVAEADYVIVESSAAAIYVRRLKRLNPRAKIIYYAADRLDTVGAHDFIRRRLAQDQRLIDHFSLRSTGMMADFEWARGRLYKADFGVNPAEFANVGPSPFPDGTTPAVSVGSMLFDASFFEIAAPLFPQLQFHVIGCGEDFGACPNVHVYPEMPFAQMLAYVKHAAVGVAPYRHAPGAEYLAESSLKLAQFDHVGIPSVCPHFAVGSAPNRIGYTPGDEASIEAAVTTALGRIGATRPQPYPSWEEVALQVIEPEQYGARRISGAAGPQV